MFLKVLLLFILILFGFFIIKIIIGFKKGIYQYSKSTKHFKEIKYRSKK